MWIFRIRNEVTNFCSTELKNWTREPKRWEGLGKGMIAVLAKLPMRNVSEKYQQSIAIYTIYVSICRTVSPNLCVCSLVHPVIFEKGAKFQIVLVSMSISPSKRIYLYKNYAAFRCYEVCTSAALKYKEF